MKVLSVDWELRRPCQSTLRQVNTTNVRLDVSWVNSDRELLTELFMVSLEKRKPKEPERHIRLVKIDAAISFVSELARRVGATAAE